jgi:ABC-2 type transport system ATP-binding protein
MTAEAPRLRVSGLAKSYGRRPVLNGVSLSIGAGSVAAVTGPNGAGKSTLLACIAGSIRCSGGALLDGAPLGPATRSRAAYLPQRVRMPASASVSQVLELFGSLAGSPSKSDGPPEGFLPSLDRQIGELSGGQAQRVALAAILTGRPDLILLDEPFANLDESGREAASALIGKHAARGATVLIASPTVMELVGVADLALRVEGGRVTFAGTLDEYLAQQEITIWVRRNGSAPGTLEGLVDALRVRQVAAWTAMECREERAVHLLEELVARGVPADHIRISDRGVASGTSPLHVGTER